MVEAEIPGFRRLQLEHLVLDYNGTLAIDGELIAGVASRLKTLSKTLRIHVLTADTFGKVRAQMSVLPCDVMVLPGRNIHQRKAAFVRKLGAKKVVAIGNGRNDRFMVRIAALGIAIVQREGASAQSAAAADVLSTHICDALDLLAHPKRLVATLRS